MKPVLWNRSLSRPAHPCVGFFSLLTTNQVASLILFGSAILENERPPLTSVAGSGPSVIPRRLGTRYRITTGWAPI